MGIALQVDNLSASVTDDDLLARFEDYGVVESATMDGSLSSTSGKLSARVVMANRQEAQAAIDWLHDTQFKGTTISVVRALATREQSFWINLGLGHR